MKYIEVVFTTLTNPEGENKRYLYKTELDLQLGSTYSIIADNKQAFNNLVKVTKIADWLPHPSSTRIITAAKLINSFKDTPLTLEEGKILQNKLIIPRKSNPIRKVYFNKEKDTTAVLWENGEKTIFKRDSRDEWDYEKVVAMAFMKKYFNNKAYYYDRLQEIIEDAEVTEVIGDGQMKDSMPDKRLSLLGMNKMTYIVNGLKETKNPPKADLLAANQCVVEELEASYLGTRGRNGEKDKIMREIQSITIVTNQGVSTITVGDIINGLEVAEIQNRSLEWENSLDTIYCAVDADGKIIKEVINCPVDITYYEI